MPTTQSQTLGQLVAERPIRSRVFEKYRIDYCCGGKRELNEACAQAGVDPDVIRRELADCDQAAGAEVQKDWSTADLGELCDHIEQTHHKYLTDEMPLLAELT